VALSKRVLIPSLRAFDDQSVVCRDRYRLDPSTTRRHIIAPVVDQQPKTMA